ncbi:MULTISPECIES: ABC transporter substrate-binding protein [Mycobacteriaceae]|uniref:ABC transporter substrate-binding protein n=1 Tax=Mycolicibacterium neoaurum VKM Ac-1815D TaxID=700508 RepID=V5X731_MYCNE|nr:MULTISPECIES: ABC transporter substrate-binding protein [Mycobacteriaceae]AHC23822.1 ABC transporter substrate-binding protein [Mycolicibacterium neoaurum VKM Ac-1815D]AMO04488.1 ABC transporter substrate-binding protein [Mycolicibacterium neoaurum]KJQ48511.1 ABC transporter substrate-binding protein [Mycolicibacterium neoaurum]KUM06897.1 ABC transporter substrate-binding protein [Mycolicibacterium neoaurum]
MSKLRDALRKMTVLSCTSVVAVFGVAACGSEGSDGSGGGEINISMTSFPDYIDPQLSYTLEGWEVLYNTYTPLLTYKHAKGEDGTQIVPGLATDMPEISDDGKTYKLKLRSGMKYSDGTDIKASDFTYAIQRLFKADSGGSVFYSGIVGAPQYADGTADTISGIVTDDATGDITITLDAANGTFENVLGLPFAAPVPPSTPLSDDATNSPPPSSGPFMITKVEAPQTLTMERNPNFSTVRDAGATEVADAQVDKIIVTQNKSNTAQVTGVEQNTIDFMVDPPDADRLQEVKTRFGDRFRLEESINTYYFWMNNQTAPFNDVRVRQAVNYAIDPEALNRVFGGRLRPTQQILPPGMPGYEEYKLYPGPDMDKARALLAEANPSDRDITVWTNDEPDRKRIGEYYHDVLNQLGFNATLKVIAGDVYFTTIGNQSTPDLDTGFGNWFQDFPHPDDFFRPLLNSAAILPTNGNNFSRASYPELDAKMDELLTKQLTEGDTEAQYAALDKAYMEQAAWAPYGNEQFTTFVSDRIDFDKAYHHLLFNQDWSALALK